MSTPPPEPSAGQVFTRGDRHRRVIAILEGRVLYCFGGNFNRSCLLQTWRRWVRRAQMVRG